MKTLSFLAVVLFTLEAQSLLAQVPGGQPPMPVPERRRVISPNGGTPAEENDLARNYKLVFSFKDGDKPAQEIVLLTASSQISVSAGLNGKDDSTLGMTSASIQGLLSEKEKSIIRFSYQLAASIPVPSQSMTSNPGTPESKSRVVSISYTTESASGVLLMEPGKSYELFKTGQHAYTVTIQPEPEQVSK